MSSDCTTSENLLLLARSGSCQSLGQLLQVYRNYLKLLVMSQLERRLQTRVSPSDVVQETCFEAHRDFLQFRGKTCVEVRAWLRQILVNNMHRVVEQHVLARKRDVRREVSLQQLANSIEESTTRLETFFPDPGTSPSGSAQRHEMEIVLADMLSELPTDYRDVIVLRHIEALPFHEVALRMERSTGAVRMLWLRAINSLREKFSERGYQ